LRLAIIDFQKQKSWAMRYFITESARRGLQHIKGWDIRTVRVIGNHPSNRDLVKVRHRQWEWWMGRGGLKGRGLPVNTTVRKGKTSR